LSKILDQYGQPIARATLDEPQTARVANLQHQFLTPMLAGLTPARLARTLGDADQGNLVQQHRLFSDMEERDGHLRAEMDKRKNALVGVPWDVVPPRNASAAEKAAAQWVKEVLQDAIDPLEDLVLSVMDGVGHGFAPVELEWRTEGSELLPAFHPRPQEWFQLGQERTAIQLTDGTVYGAPLRPFGWIMHTPGKAKTGYGARLGLYRTLVWPFLYKAYALGDFAEFLETYGLPIIVGKYFAGASAEEKASLFRAVTQLGHDARAIMPKDMELEIQKITGGGGEPAHLRMMEWAEKSVSKSILGQTLSADTGSNGGGSYALGKVHNEVRHDILVSDARQVAATLTRDLVYPLIALNRSGIDGLRRCPRFTFDLGEAEDLSTYAEALPKLVGVGMQIPLSWAQEKLHIPQPEKGEAVLTNSQQASPATRGEPLVAELATRIPATAEPAPTASPVAAEVDQVADVAAPTWAGILGKMTSLVDAATDLPALQRSLLDTFGGQPQDDLVKLMAAALALAELKGMAAVQEEA
jgi:phage gp29-like protein